MVFGKSASNRASVPSVRPRNPGAADAPASNVMSLELMRAGFTRGMYRVLLAHDLTVQSEIALVRASRLALERRGHLIILHIVDSRLPARVIEAQRTRARSYLEAEARKWLGRGRLTYSIDIGVGEPAGAIAARAQAHGVDLVVTGRHQRALAHGHIRAITVGRLLQQIQRPLLVVTIRTSPRTDESSSRSISRAPRRRDCSLRQPSFPRRASTFFTQTGDVSRITLRASRPRSAATKDGSPLPQSRRDQSRRCPGSSRL
jgi:nucleotide-binding universal stress UspA family protein